MQLTSRPLSEMARQEPQEEVNAALAALIGRPETVLDVGCGAGVNRWWLAPAAHG